MIASEALGIDLIRELRLRQWARTNFVPRTERPATWHPIVLDEMLRRDQELIEAARHPMMASRFGDLAEAS
jgi:hypothetical protein